MNPISQKDFKKWLMLAAVVRGVVAGLSAVAVTLLVLFGVVEAGAGRALVLRLLALFVS